MSGYGSLQPDTRQMTEHTKGMDLGNYHSTGQTGSSVSPLKERIEQLKDFFGQPTKNIDSIQNDYDNDHQYGDVEYEDYPEAFKAFEGRSNFLQRTMIEKIKASENYQLTRMAPWFHSQHMTFEWNEARFHKHMLDREPEEAVPRMTTHTYRSGSASMVRYGICLMLERNFYLTPKGQQTYLFNLEQLRIAAVETCSHGVMVAVLEHKPYEDWNDKYMNRNVRAKIDCDDIFKQETGEFAIIHKSTDGYKMLKSKLMRVISERNNGEAGDFTILPQGMIEFTKESIDEGKYYLDGGRGPAGIDAASVAVSRGFSFGEHSVAVDPFFRDTTIGGYGTLSDEHARGAIEDYRTRQLDCSIYDESSDKFQPLRYADTYKHAGAWDFRKVGAPLTEIGQGYTADWGCYTWGQLLRKDNNLQRAIDKLLTIKDEGVRSEFVQALKILPKGDERVLKTGPPAPGTFNQTLFTDMFGLDASQWNGTFAKMYSVKQVSAIEGRKRTHTGMGNQELDIESGEYEEEKLRQSRGPAVNKRPRTVDASVFHDDNLMEDVQGAAGSGRYVQTAPGAYVYQPAPQGERRFKHAAVSHFDLAGLVAPEGPSVDDVKEAIVRSAQKFQPATGGIEAKTLTVGEKDRKVSNVTEALFTIVDSVVALSGLTDSQRITALAELNRVIANEADKRTGTPIGADGAVALITVHYAPFVAKVEAYACLAFAGANKTPLESSYAANPGQDVPNLVNEAKSGAWTPDVASKDDGQLEMLFVPSFSTGTPLLHDAMAATVAGSHQVLFRAPDAVITKPQTLVLDGVKRSRADLLAWSVALSLLAGSISKATKVDELEPILLSMQTDKGLVTRLNRVSSSAAALPTLPSQLHLSSYITALSALLVASLSGLQVPVEVYKAVITEVKALHASYGSLESDFLSTVKNGYIVALKPLSASSSTSARDAIGAQEVKGILDVDLPAHHPLVSRLAVRAAREAIGSLTAPRSKNTILAILDGWWSSAKTEYSGEPLAAANWGAVKNSLAELYNNEKYGAIGGGALNSSPAKSEQGPSWTAAGLAFLLDHASLISGGYYKFCVDRDIPVPFFVRYWRPAKTYNMGAVVHMCSGINGAARTAYKNPDFMLAENAAQKMLFGHFTMYNTTMVTAPEKIAIAKNVFCRRYQGGNDMNVWNPFSIAHKNDYRDGRMGTASMFITLGLMNQSKPYAFWLSMTGVMPSSLNVDKAVARGVAYPGANAFSSHWGFGADNGDGLVQSTRNQYSCTPNQLERKFNVICMQEVQINIYNSMDPSKPIVYMDKGHWGDRVYEGCSAVREGRKMHLDIPSYHDIKAFTLK